MEIENIKIYDNVLTEQELSICLSYIYKPKWEWGHKSININSSVVSSPFWYMELSTIDYFTIIIKDKIELITNNKYTLNRVYVNGQTFGQNGSFHQDDENDNCYTFCLYLSYFEDSIIDDIGGCIQFKLPSINKYTINIDTIFNRGILFPSKYFHRGLSFSRYSPDLRICVAWKFTLNNGIMHTM
jgi:hypothetical protein